MFEEYLGDGVYAVWCHGIVTLDLRAQDRSRIVLEPSIRARLDDFCERCMRKALREELTAVVDCKNATDATNADLPAELAQAQAACVSLRSVLRRESWRTHDDSCEIWKILAQPNPGQTLLDELAAVKADNAQLRNDVACFEAMKEGVQVRLNDLEANNAKLRRAIEAMAQPSKLTVWRSGIVETCGQWVYKFKRPGFDTAAEAALAWLAAMEKEA